jgi:DNA-directed RNA polymerase specialized sigma subunit
MREMEVMKRVAVAKEVLQMLNIGKKKVQKELMKKYLGFVAYVRKHTNMVT